MRIVIDLQACQTPGSRTRGIGRWSMAFAQAMVRNSDHEFWLALNGRYSEAALSIRAAFRELIPAERIRLFDVSPGVAANEPWNDWRRESSELVYEAFLQSLRPDVVHVSSLIEGYESDAVTSVGRLARDHLVSATFYDAIPLMNPDPYLKSESVRRWYFRKLLEVKRADLLFPISHSSRQEVLDHLGMNPDDVVAAPIAVDDAFRPMAIDQSEEARIREAYGLRDRFLMYTGGIDFRKNVEGLIEAYADLPASVRNDVQLAIVCSVNEADRVRLHALGAKVGLRPDDLVLTGFVPERDLLILYNLCYLFVFPSFHEGFGLPPLEAMACGAPTIGADNSAISEVIAMPEALFDARRPQEISRRIYRGLTDETFRALLKRNAAEQSKKYDRDRCVAIALEAIERRVTENRPRSREVYARRMNIRPRLAVVSPLPPLQTGIANYAAELLPELALHYDIEVVADQEYTSDSWLGANFAIRSPQWFLSHADRYDRILYQFGNSEFHAWMFELIERVPGTVVLHDVFLSQLQDWRETHEARPEHFLRSLARSEGASALVDYVEKGREGVMWKYPVAAEVAQVAKGIIVHSRFAVDKLATSYGLSGDVEVRQIPHLRVVPPVDRDAARKALCLSAGDRLLCSFGGIGMTKCTQQVVKAFKASSLAKDPRWRLVLVGSNDNGKYGRQLMAEITRAPLADRIGITGFADFEVYRQYLAAADGAVQLRALSRGETSGAVFDCLAHGVPLIVNGHATLSELDDSLVTKLPDRIDISLLSQAMEKFEMDRDACRKRAARAQKVIEADHHPARIARLYRDATEAFSTESRQALEDRLVRRVADLVPPVPPTADDLTVFATTVASTLPKPSLPRIFVDVSVLVQEDAKSGVQRVVKAVMDAILRSPPAGYHVEPIYAHWADEWPVYRFARRLTSRTLGMLAELEDEVVEPANGDIFLGLDLSPDAVAYYTRNGMLAQLRAKGVAVHFVIYDLLPITRPDLFEELSKAPFRAWLESVTRIADGAICISRSVAAELVGWLDGSGIERETPLKVGYFPLGADFPDSIASTGIPVRGKAIFAAMAKRPSLLMVGTLEPRKAHGDILDAVEDLWKRGVDVNLIIVGKRGWLTDGIYRRILKHREHQKRLWWEEQASDEYLDKIYGSATALVAGSVGEGFGLPLVEAIRRDCPVIARDIPVFREVMGDGATYFAFDGSNAADTIATWLANPQTRAPLPKRLPAAKWAQSASALVNLLIGDGNPWLGWWQSSKSNNFCTTRMAARGQADVTQERSSKVKEAPTCAKASPKAL